jgi:hypothetical protein
VLIASAATTGSLPSTTSFIVHLDPLFSPRRRAGAG